MLPFVQNLSNLRYLGRAVRVGAGEAVGGVEDITLGAAYAYGRSVSEAVAVGRVAKYGFYAAGAIGLMAAGGYLIRAVRS